MATQGPLYPATAANDSSVGTTGWTFPNNARTENNVGAYILNVSSQSQYLVTSNFGFSIPIGATIDGIYVEIRNKGDYIGGGTVTENSVVIRKSNGTFGSTNKAYSGGYIDDVYAYKNYGGPSDLWGETWAPADINNSNFGIALSATANLAEANIDVMRITVYYTPSPGQISNISSINNITSITI